MKKIFWLTPPTAPDERGVFHWVCRPFAFARITGLIASVRGDASPRIRMVIVGAGIEPWQRLPAPPGLENEGMSKALVDAALRAAPLPCEPGMLIDVEAYCPDIEAIGLEAEILTP
jgi:hypothetical protein